MDQDRLIQVQVRLRRGALMIAIAWLPGIFVTTGFGLTGSTTRGLFKAAFVVAVAAVLLASTLRRRGAAKGVGARRAGS